MDNFRTTLAIDAPGFDAPADSTPYRFDAAAPADDPLGDEAAFPSTWQTLAGGESLILD